MVRYRLHPKSSKGLLLLVFLFVTLFQLPICSAAGAPKFEVPTNVRASDVLPPELISGSNYQGGGFSGDVDTLILQDGSNNFANIEDFEQISAFLVDGGGQHSIARNHHLADCQLAHLQGIAEQAALLFIQ